MEQKSVALSNLSKLARKVAGFARENERRLVCQDLLHLFEFGVVRPTGLMLGGEVPPTTGVPGVVHVISLL